MNKALGKIITKKVPASEAIPGNEEHARLMEEARRKGQGASASRANGDGWTSRVDTGLSGPTLAGLIIVGVFILMFGLWAAFAPLAGAAVAHGVVSASGQNLRIQHFEGGMIDQILVQEGDTVSRDQPLLTLDSTDALATRDRYRKQLIGLRARAERLQAERDGEDVRFSDQLKQDAINADLQVDLAEQTKEFDKRSERYATDEKIANQQIVALQQQEVGLRAQEKSAREQIAVIEQEIAVKSKLVKRKLAPKSQLLRLQRSRSELEGRIGDFVSRIGETRSSIVKAMEQKLRLQAERSEAAAAQLNEVRSSMAETEELIRTAEDVLSRVIVRAPADGVVVNINKNTPGSVVRKAEDLVVLLPRGGELIIEARLEPQDIDVVNVGQGASLRFSTLNTRTTPEVEGQVSYISADRQIDPNTNEAFYTARLTFTDTLPQGFNRGLIYPGMPVETYIETGDRTFFQYLTKPITDSFSRAFREE